MRFLSIFSSADGDAPQRGVPIAGVIAHAGQEGDLAREHVSQDHRRGQHREQHQWPRGGEVGDADVGVCDEQRQHAEDHEDVPLQRHPIGIADKIPRWKHTITNAAIAVGQPPWEKNSANGDQHLDGGADGASRWEKPAGAQVVRELREERALEEARPHHRAVGHHRRDHEREVAGDLGGGGPIQIAMQTSFAARMMSTRRTGTPPRSCRRPRRGRPGRSPCRAGRPAPAAPGRRRSATSAAGPLRCRAPGWGRCRRRTAPRSA